MKKLGVTILSIVFIFSVTSMTQAQLLRGGVKGGLNLSNLYIDDVEDENVRTGFHAGVYTQLPLGPAMALQPELNYSTKGAKADFNIPAVGVEGESKFNLNYLDVPLLLTFKLGDDADIHFGPYAAYLVGVSSSLEGNFGDVFVELDRDDYNKWDFGLSGGFALNFDPLSIGLRYNYGLSQIADSDRADAQIGDAKNSVAQVYLAFNMMR